MKAARMRLIVAALLFFAWLGWLGYLAVKASIEQNIVLSRPQFLMSNLDVIGEIQDIDFEQKDTPTAVKVVEVHWPAAEKKLEGKTIQVARLGECRRDWRGPGLYILPLIHPGPDKYEVAPTPPSPGFPPPREAVQSDGSRVLRIYPANPQTLAQLNAIPKPSP
jgi:hypothetical protein